MRNEHDKCCIIVIEVSTVQSYFVGVVFGIINNEFQFKEFATLSEEGVLEECKTWGREKLGDKCEFSE